MVSRLGSRRLGNGSRSPGFHRNRESSTALERGVEGWSGHDVPLSILDIPLERGRAYLTGLDSRCALCRHDNLEGTVNSELLSPGPTWVEIPSTLSDLYSEKPLRGATVSVWRYADVGLWPAPLWWQKSWALSEGKLSAHGPCSHPDDGCPRSRHCPR